jgi:iron complex outermembrane receptor protein
MVWAAVSRAVRTPSRFDRDLFQPDPSYAQLLVGNNSFQSEDVIAYELGYRAQITSKLSGSLSAFFNDYNHIRSLNVSSSGGLPLQFGNNLKAQTYGFELSANYQILDWWRLHWGYDLLEERISVGPGGDVSNGRNETADPEHQFFLRSSMDLPFKMELDAASRFISKVYNNSGSTVGSVPGYAELDVRIAWHPRNDLEISLVGQNLVHDRHPEAGYPGPAQEEIERAVYGKIAWRF